MPRTSEGRVAVYIDFDNIVISRYEQKHRRGRGKAVNLRDLTADALVADPELAARLLEARVDLGAVLDFASSFGAIAVSRAYADWSIEVNAGYREQLMDRAVDLVQLFPAVRPAKNGADIRLAVDVVEDLFRLPDLTHVVIVAGDSDYIALAQRCKRLGRYVVGIGVAGSTSKFLSSACDEFADYDALPGVTDALREVAPSAAAGPAGTSAEVAVGSTESVGGAPAESPAASSAKKSHRGAGAATKAAKAVEDGAGAAASGGNGVTGARGSSDGGDRALGVKPAAQRAASDLLRRALRLSEAKDDVDWITSSAVKNQMLRMDPSFQESALGYKTFTEFVKSRGNLVELKEDGQSRLIRLREAPESGK